MQGGKELRRILGVILDVKHKGYEIWLFQNIIIASFGTFSK